MFNPFKKLFDYNAKELQKLQKKVDEINALEDKARNLKKSDFKKETEALKQDIQSNKKTLEQVLPWAFALTREAARRTLDMRHFDVQLMAGIAMHEGNIVEQRTGEGKTLSATTALYLNALTGKGVHLVTVNDYLARRDAGWMGTIFNFLGLTTSAIISDESFIFDDSHIAEDVQDWRLKHLKPTSRKEAYAADITYGINSEFGFDYLRDNMAKSKDDLMQRGFHYAVVDEVDSVLIDEARTPHIISAAYDEDVSKYYDYAKLIKRLDRENDYIINEKEHRVNLTDKGIAKIEKLLGVENVYETHYETIYHVEAALKAETLFKANKDYIVRDDEVMIVDEFTGRLLSGRRFSEGIHQALEAKEGITIKQESRTLATVSLQNYFRMYEKLAGMTGTAVTEAEEFHKIYNMNVIVMPTHRDNLRKDHTDLIYKTERGKFTAVVEQIETLHKEGRPVLVGTTSIEKNEFLAALLKKKGIPHNLLNAKNHQQEATIIANAGKKGGVTIATNMAGRGVDIILGGSMPNKAEETDEKDFQKDMEKWQKEHDAVVEAGGLFVIGTERHESRRIDNQLRGRAARQGDPGDTRFYVSLEDDMMRIFGGEQVSKLMTFFNIPENQPLEHSLVTKALEQAQSKVEGANFDTRKHLVEYDDVLARQRDIFYTMRREVLHKGTSEKGLSAFFLEMVARVVEQFIAPIEGQTAMLDTEIIEQELAAMLPIQKGFFKDDEQAWNIEEMQKKVISYVKKLLKTKEKEIGVNEWNQVMQMVMLDVMDDNWTSHLTAIDDLRAGIGLRSVAQLDPLVEYKNEAFSMFEKLLSDIDFNTIRQLTHLHVSVPEKLEKELEQEDARKIQYKPASEQVQFAEVARSAPEAEVFEEQVSQEENLGGIKFIPTGTAARKINRNDPCPCGSGKKWKKCHYPDLP